MKNFLPPPGSLLEARKVHLCVRKGEGIRKGDESQFSLGYAMDSASRHLLGLYCFPPVSNNSAMMYSVHQCLYIDRKNIILPGLGSKVPG